MKCFEAEKPIEGARGCGQMMGLDEEHGVGSWMRVEKELYFLDASTHLYKRLCLSIGRSVGCSVGWSDSRSVFFMTEKTKIMKD